MALFDRFTSALRRLSGVDAPAASGNDFEKEAHALIDQGNKLEDAGSLELAKTLYERAAQLVPTLAKAHLNRGNVLLALGQPENAIQAYSTAILHQPDYAAAYFNIGNAQVACKRPQDALKAYEKALALNPNFVDARVAQGNVLSDLEKFEAAVISYQAALVLCPNYAEVHVNLGIIFRSLDRLNDAVTSFSKAVALKPDFIDAHCELANVYRELGQSASAIKFAKLARDIDSNEAGVWSLLLFCLSNSQDIGRQALFDEHRRFGEHFEPQLLSSRRPHLNVRDPARVLKVGFVSADLRNHAVTSFFEPILVLLLKMPSLSIHIYDTGGLDDAVSRRIKSAAIHWLDVSKLSNEKLTDLIREEVIDVLIDLSGHTPAHRLLMFGRKPAPIQMSWIGYPGTTGLKSIDYYVGDRHFLPPGEFDDLFAERILRIPVNAPFQCAHNPPNVNTLPALKNGFMTFGSFNRIDKIGKEVVSVWSQLLRAFPSSKMFMAGMPPAGSFEQLIQWFKNEGVGPERLIFQRRASMESYLKQHHEVDVCLDTFPYGGGTTTCHAATMGVPTLTLVGSTPGGRTGYSVLSHLGLQEIFAAVDRQDFLSKGAWCATHLDELADIRSGLRGRFMASALSKPHLSAEGLAHGIRHAWKRWCAELPVESFEVLENDGIYTILDANQSSGAPAALAC